MSPPAAAPSAVTPAATPALGALLAAGRSQAVEFGHGLANHLPMALVILERLGAGPDHLAAYAEAYATANGLDPAPPDGHRVGAATWQDQLGARALEGDLRGFFLREVAALGVDETLRRHLPTLVPGIAASALHALMRLAYGRLADDPAEIGTALGYWAATWLPLRPVEAEAEVGAEPVADAGNARTDNPAALLAALRAAPGLCRLEPPTDLLWHWMRAVAAEPAFPDVAARLVAAPDVLARVAWAGLALMAGTMTFEAVHAVTGAHWLRILRPLWPDEGLAVRYFWQAIAAVYPKIGSPPLPAAEWLLTERRRPCPDWQEIKSRAILSDDEHDLSFTFSAFEEERCYGDRLYRVLAARRLGLIP